MTLELLQQWWNLIFIVPFLLALVYLVVYALSGISFGDTDVDADADISSDAAADSDADAHVDSTLHPEAASHVNHHADGKLMLTILSWVGVGRTPLSIVLMMLMLSWGLIGFAANRLFEPLVPASLHVAALSLPLALLGSVLATRWMSQLMHRYLPLSETYAQRRHALLGSVGEALYSIDSKFGMVFIRDERGEVFQVPCRVAEGSPIIAKGQKVQLVSYHGPDKMFYGIPYKSADADTIA